MNPNLRNWLIVGGIIGTIISIIAFPFLAYREFIILSNPDKVIYVHKNSKFISSAFVSLDNELKFDVAVPVNNGPLGPFNQYCNGVLPNRVGIYTVDLPDGINVDFDTTDMKAMWKYREELESYGVNPRYVEIKSGWDYIITYPTLFTTSDGRQFIIYHKYNRLYLHVVK